MTDTKAHRYQPTFIPNDLEKTIRIPWSSNASDQASFGNHINNIQWLAQGFGGTLNPEQTEWIFRFDSEEYNCAIRYLSNPKFNWVRV